MHSALRAPRSNGTVCWRSCSVVDDAKDLIERNLGAHYAPAAGCRRGAQASIADRLCELRVGPSQVFGGARTTKSLSDRGVVRPAVGNGSVVQDDDNVGLGKELDLRSSRFRSKLAAIWAFTVTKWPHLVRHKHDRLSREQSADAVLHYVHQRVLIHSGERSVEQK